MKLWENRGLVEEIVQIFNDCVDSTDHGVARIILQAVEREQEKDGRPKFVTYFQTVQTTFGPSRRGSDGCGYDHRFRSIGVGAVTEAGAVWLYCYDYDMSWDGGDALTRWVRADGNEVQQIPGMPS